MTHSLIHFYDFGDCTAWFFVHTCFPCGVAGLVFLTPYQSFFQKKIKYLFVLHPSLVAWQFWRAS